MIARVKGVFERYQAEVAFYLDDSSTASVRFYIDAASVTTRYNLRDEHLKSDLLLHVEEHPYVTFVVIIQRSRAPGWNHAHSVGRTHRRDGYFCKLEAEMADDEGSFSLDQRGPIV